MTAATDRTRWAALLIVLTVMRPPSEAAPQAAEAEPAEAAA